MTLSEGDEKKAKYKYIDLRVKGLIAQQSSTKHTK